MVARLGFDSGNQALSGVKRDALKIAHRRPEASQKTYKSLAHIYRITYIKITPTKPSMYEIDWSKKAAKQLVKSDHTARNMIVGAVRSLRDFPNAKNVIALANL